MSKLLPRTVTGRGLGGQNNTPPPMVDEREAELSADEILGIFIEMLDRIGPAKMAWLVLGVPNENQRGRRHAVIRRP